MVVSINGDISSRARNIKTRGFYWLFLFTFVFFSCDNLGSKKNRETGTDEQKEGSVRSGTKDSSPTKRDAVSNDSSAKDTSSTARDAVSDDSSAKDTSSTIRDAVSTESDSSGDASQWESSGGLGRPEPLFTFTPRGPPTEVVYGLRIDGEYLYWMQSRGRLMRGKKNGDGEPEELVASTEGSVWSFYVDSQYVYWVRSDSLGRYNKATGEISSIPLDGEHDAPLQIAGDDNRIYLVELGCAYFVYVSKRDGSSEVATLERQGGIGGGGGIAVDETHVYCNGAGDGSTMGTIYRRAKSGGEIEKVVTMPINDRCNNGISGIFIVDDLLYFNYHYYYCSEYTGGAFITLASVSKSGGEFTEIIRINNSLGGGGLYDKSRKTIYFWPTEAFVEAGKSAKKQTLANYSLVTNRLLNYDLTSFVNDSSIILNGTLVDDEDYLYWTEFYGVYRQAKLAPKVEGN